MENSAQINELSGRLREPEPRYSFRDKLVSWTDKIVHSDVTNMKEVGDALYEIENSLDLKDEDLRMLGLFSEVIGYISKVEANKSNKMEAVKVQQNFVEEVLSRTKNGEFIDEGNLSRFFLSMSEVNEKFIKDKIPGMDMVKGFMMGIRGMVSTTLLFSRAGFDVKIPDEKWDAYHDVDLLVTRNGKTYSVSVKSERDNIDIDTDRSFSVKTLAKPADLPKEYYDKVSKHIWINIPSQTLEKETIEFCDPLPREKTIGSPNNKSVAELNSRLHLLSVD